MTIASDPANPMAVNPPTQTNGWRIVTHVDINSAKIEINPETDPDPASGQNAPHHSELIYCLSASPRGRVQVR